MSSMKEKYNLKIDYTFCKFLAHSKRRIVDERRNHAIYEGKCQPRKKEEKVMMKGKMILSWIKKETTKFNLKNIMRCYEILSDEKLVLEDRKRAFLKEIIKRFNEDSDSDLASKSFVMIIKEGIFPKKWNIEMSKIIHNFIQIKKEHLPTIFLYWPIERIKELISQDEIEGAIVSLIRSYQRSECFNSKHPLVDHNEIILKLRTVKEELKAKYGVIKVYMYGSYAHGTYSEYSDLDLYIQVEEKYGKDNKNTYLLKRYLEYILHLPIDGKVWAEAPNKENITKDMIRDLKEII